MHRRLLTGGLYAITRRRHTTRPSIHNTIHILSVALRLDLSVAFGVDLNRCCACCRLRSQEWEPFGVPMVLPLTESLLPGGTAADKALSQQVIARYGWRRIACLFALYDCPKALSQQVIAR